MEKCCCKKCLLWIIVAIVIIVVAVCFFVCKKSLITSNELSTTTEEQSDVVSDSNGDTEMSDLVIEDLIQGQGTEASEGKMVTVHYTGTLTDGTKFDSSVDRGTPFNFQLGIGQVIKGWDLGVKGMKIGGKRKLTIPPSLGYGSRAIGPIPANSTLIFEVELLDVK